MGKRTVAGLVAAMVVVGVAGCRSGGGGDDGLAVQATIMPVRTSTTIHPLRLVPTDSSSTTTVTVAPVTATTVRSTTTTTRRTTTSTTARPASTTTTVAPAPTPTTTAPAATTTSVTLPACHPNYGGCLDPNASDYDCLGSDGNGPLYTGPVEIHGADPFALDVDGDGIACELD